MNQQPWQKLPIKRVLQPEQRARWERRLAEGYGETDDFHAPDLYERTIMGLLQELKDAEQIIASFPAAAPVEVPDSVLDLICRDVAELPDRSSPNDWPEAMLVTNISTSSSSTKPWREAIAKVREFLFPPAPKEQK